jgi:hypothetical protein
VGQPRSAEPGPQLKPLLERLPILLTSGIFNGDGVVTLADYTAFLGLALASGIPTSRGGEAGSETNFAISSCSKRLGLVQLLHTNQYSKTEVISY